MKDLIKKNIIVISKHLLIAIIPALYLLGARQGGSIVPKILFNPFTWIILLVISVVVYLFSLKVMMSMEVEE